MLWCLNPDVEVIPRKCLNFLVLRAKCILKDEEREREKEPDEGRCEPNDELKTFEQSARPSGCLIFQ